MLRQRREWVGLALAVAVGSACDSPMPQGPTEAVTVGDSAGVPIVHNHAPVWDSASFWTVEPTPVFSIGGSNGGAASAQDDSHLVWGVAAAAPLSDGRVVILSSHGERKVLVFEPSGSLSASFGREGLGPGEFSFPRHLHVLAGDTIVVWDLRYGPVGYFDPTGRLLRHRTIDLGAVVAATATADQFPVEFQHLPLADGSFLTTVLSRRWQLPEANELYRQPVGHMRIDTAYAVHPLGWWEGLEGISPHDAALPFLPYPAGWMATGGGIPPSIYVSNGDRYEVRQFSAAGVLARIIGRDFEPIPITYREMEDYKTRLPNPLVDQTEWERAMAALPERFHPAVSNLLLDSEGHLWVQNRMAGGEWSVFDAEGRWLGDVVMPPVDAWLHSVKWIGRDLIIRVEIDFDTGVESVKGYRLNRNTG